MDNVGIDVITVSLLLGLEFLKKKKKEPISQILVN